MGTADGPVNLIRSNPLLQWGNVDGYDPKTSRDDVPKPMLVFQEERDNPVDSVNARSNPPVSSPTKHLAAANPPRSDLRKLSQSEYDRSKEIYQGSDDGPSLYERGIKWFGRMKDWMTGKELDLVIKGVDETFGDFAKDVLLEGWQFVYDQLKGIQVIGCNFLGMHSEISKMKSGEEQVEALIAYDKLGADFLEIIEKEGLKIEAEKEDALKGVEDPEKRNEIEQAYQEKQKALTRGAVDQLNKFAVQMSPELRKEGDKLSKIMERLFNCEAALLIAQNKEEAAEALYDAALLEYQIAGDSENPSRYKKARQAVDKAEVAYHKAKDYREEVETKMKRLINQESVAHRRYDAKRNEIEENIGQATIGLRADAKLGRILQKEGATAAGKKWTWIIGDTLWTVQEACSVVGYLGIPVVSLVALGVSLVVKGFRSAMYMDSTLDRSKEAMRAGKIGKALDKMDDSDDAALGAISKLIKRNLAYKEKSIKAFVVSLSLVSTAAWTFAALAQAGVALGVTAGVVASIANPVAWGIGGIVLATGCIFSAYQLAKYLHGYYKQHKVEKVLDDALAGLQGDKCDDYNKLFMKYFEEVSLEDFTPEQVQQFVAIANEQVDNVCKDKLEIVRSVRAEAEAIAADRTMLRDGQSSAYNDLFKEHLAGLVPEGMELSDQTPEDANAFIDAANAKVIEYCNLKEKELESVIVETSQGVEEKKSDLYSNIFRQELSDVMAREDVARTHDKMDRVNKLIIEESMYELMKLKPDYGLRVLLDRIKSGDEKAIKFVEDLNVFDKDELYIMRNCSTAAEPLILERMNKRLGFS